jgi:hypothetical protein
MQASRHKALQRCQDLQRITYAQGADRPAQVAPAIHFVSGHAPGTDPALVRWLQQRPGQIRLGRELQLLSGQRNARFRSGAAVDGLWRSA